MDELIKKNNVEEFLEFDFGIKLSNRGGKAFKIFKGQRYLKVKTVDFFGNNRKEEVCKITEIFEKYSVPKELIKKIIKMDLLFILLLEGWNRYNLKDYMEKIDQYVENQSKYYEELSVNNPTLHSYKLNDFDFALGENFKISFENNKMKFKIFNKEIASYGEEFTNLLANIVMDGLTSPQSLIADLTMDATNREMNIEIPAGERVSSEKIYTGMDEFKSIMKDNYIF